MQKKKLADEKKLESLEQIVACATEPYLANTTNQNQQKTEVKNDIEETKEDDEMDNETRKSISKQPLSTTQATNMNETEL